MSGTSIIAQIVVPLNNIFELKIAIIFSPINLNIGLCLVAQQNRLLSITHNIFFG